MAKAYQYDATGCFVGEIEDYGGPLPNNAMRTAPQEVAGHVPFWNGEKWEQKENHKGEEGYVDGLPFTVKDYGPYPAGWSTDPPPPTMLGQVQAVQAKYQGALTALATSFTTATMLGDTEEAAAIQSEYATMLANMENEIAALTG